MRRFFDGLSGLITRRPVVVLVASLVLSLAVASFSAQAVNEDGVAVENELTAAQDVLDERFGEQQSVLQVVVQSTDGSDVRTAAALAYAERLEEAIRDSDVADTLLGDDDDETGPSAGLAEDAEGQEGPPEDVAEDAEGQDGPPEGVAEDAEGQDGPPEDVDEDAEEQGGPPAGVAGDGGDQPAIASYLGGAQLAAAQAGLDPEDLDDAEVVELQQQALDELPPQVAGLFEGLLAETDPPDAGLILVFQDADGLGEDETLAQQADLAEVVRGVDTPEGLTATPFGFGLLLDGSDIGPEVGRLFGTALAIILVILAIVYWVKPEVGQRRVIGRRTAADVGLTLAVIVLAVGWMQGLGVLLGPDYAGLIGYFSPQTQIVPILIVGLGVDFAIHLLARYRAEVGGSGDPDASLGVAARTVGLTLLLCTAATAIGFLTNLASPVDFLATLGVLAAVGIAAAFLLTLTFLPAARLLLDRRAARRERLPQAALATQTSRGLPQLVGRAAWLAERVPVPTLLVALLLAGVGGYGFTQLDSRFELTDFVPQDEPLLDTFEVISDRFNGGFEESTEILLRGDLATAEAHDGLVAAIEELAEVDGVETLGDEADATSPVSAFGEALGDEEIAAQLAELGLEDELTVGDAEDDDVAAAYDLLLAEVDAAEDVLAEDDEQWLGRVSVRTNAGQAGAGQLERDLLEAFSPVRDAGVEVTATSQEIVQARIGDDIEDSQIVSLLIALGAAMLLLVLHYAIADRRPLLGVLTVLPVGLVLALTFGAMALSGIPLNPVTATLAALSIGIGVPFTIHVTSRFLEERRVEGQEDTALRRTVSQTGGALVGSALTTAIGFGVLITSTLLPFEQLGYVIVFAIAFSVVASIGVLPSLLALWDRWDRRGSDRSADRTPRSEQAARV